MFIDHGTYRHADQIRKCKENVSKCPLSLHSDPAAVVLMENEVQTASICGEKWSNWREYTCVSDNPPVLLPQQVMPVVQKERNPVLFP